MASNYKKKFPFIGLDGKEYKVDDRAREFINEYIANGYNMTFAYIKAYYHDKPTERQRKDAHWRARNILRKPDVNAYLELRRKEHFDALFIDGNRIIEELAKVGFVCVDSKDVPASVKTQALDKLAKIYGLYEEKAKQEPQEIHITIQED